LILVGWSPVAPDPAGQFMVVDVLPTTSTPDRNAFSGVARLFFQISKFGVEERNVQG